VATCAVVVALLTLWIFIPIAFGSHAPHDRARDAQPLTPHSKTVAATNNIRVIGIYSARPTAELASADAHQIEIMRQSASAAASSEPVTSVVVQSSQDTDRSTVPRRAIQPSLQTAAFQVETVAIPQPPLPRRRPHVSAAIPLPYPRPVLETDEHPAIPDVGPDRLSVIN
jgi:hypothetical protein